MFMLRKQALSFTQSSLTVTLNPKRQFPHVTEPGHRGFISVWHSELGLPTWGLSGQTLRISLVLFWSDSVLCSIDSHGTELGRRVHVTTGPELLSKEHDLSKYVSCRRHNYKCLPNG